MTKLLFSLVMVLAIAGAVYFLKESGKDCELAANSAPVNVCAPGFQCISGGSLPPATGKCTLVLDFLKTLKN